MQYNVVDIAMRVMWFDNIRKSYKSPLYFFCCCFVPNNLRPKNEWCGNVDNRYIRKYRQKRITTLHTCDDVCLSPDGQLRNKYSTWSTGSRLWRATSATSASTTRSTAPCSATTDRPSVRSGAITCRRWWATWCPPTGHPRRWVRQTHVVVVVVVPPAPANAGA